MAAHATHWPDHGRWIDGDDSGVPGFAYRRRQRDLCRLVDRRNPEYKGACADLRALGQLSPCKRRRHEPELTV
jgi:hypothetical protein